MLHRDGGLGHAVRFNLTGTAQACRRMRFPKELMPLFLNRTLSEPAADVLKRGRNVIDTLAYVGDGARCLLRVGYRAGRAT